MTDLLQRQASSPSQSVFVSANAGTGKTKVLIERVLRLLLSGEVPETILCVTFTRAAAAEIEARLHRKLAEWAVAQPTDLIHDISRMTGAVPTGQTIEVARRLFAQVIDNDQGPRIETTHSFCQSLLSRFPIEAGLPPQFELITDVQKERFLQAAFADAFADPHQEMKEALAHLIEIADHQTLFDHIKRFVSTRHLSDAAAAMPLGFVPKFASAMQALVPQGLANKQEADAFYAGQILAMPWRDLADAVPEKMADFITWQKLEDAERACQLEMLAQVFLTKTGTPKARFLPKKLGEDTPELADIYQRLAALVIAHQKALSAFATIARSKALYVVGRFVASAYERQKLRHALLDYDDLIIKADRLLSATEAMAWVRWKLDFGIHHMLVDEAQDTNPAQWDLLASLADEFFAHEADDSDETRNRTLFSVGDFKQSIYSFQGANPHVFVEKGAEFDAKAQGANHRFSEVALAMSFRSSKAVLDMVNHVMTGEDVEGLGGAYQQHDAFFSDKFGMVELWPIVSATEKAPSLPYFDVPDFVSDAAMAQYGADALLAEQIAAHIKTMLDGTAYGLNGKAYQPRDIMILVNKRNSIFTLLRGALWRQNIPVAGADRLRLGQQIEIQDLLALGDICILPEDDLQLAAFLKSPLIGLSEEGLYEIAQGRKKDQSLLAVLKGYAGADNEFGAAIAQIEHYFALSASLSPAAFYETILAQGGREAFFKRLGTAITDSLNGFLDQAYEFEAQGGASLADFIAHQRLSDSEIKRDFGNIQENHVRIMTIHGSKGLESPVVYVPDIIKGVEPSQTLVSSDEALYWPADTIYMPEIIAQLKEADRQARTAEHQRLLYVAMTRASECLFLAGYEKSRTSLKGVSWDVLLQKGFEAAGIEADDTGVWRYIHTGGAASGQADERAPSAEDGAALPDVRTAYPWAFCPPPQEDVPLKPLVPSAMDEGDVPVSVASSGEAGTSAMRSDRPRLEGIFMHELLDRLSALPMEARRDFAHAYAQASLIAKSPAEAPIGTARLVELANHMLAFMAQEAFAPLFGKQALSEFHISGLVGTRPVVGQIDRLVITQDDLWLVDFKSGQPMGHNVPQSYVVQMALYAALLQQIYPDKTLRCEIIWLRDFSTTMLAQDRLTAALAAKNLH